jgi:beta-N-acetylglucosaminidase
MKNTKHKRATLLSFLLIVALVFQVPLYAFAETEPGVATEGNASGENAAGTGEPTSDDSISGEASDPDALPSGEQTATDPTPADDTSIEAEPGINEAGEEDPDATLETLATPDFNGALVTITSVLAPSKGLDIFGKSDNPEARVILWPQMHTPNQRFKLVRDNNGYYTITSLKSNLVLDVSGNNAANGSPVIQFTSKNGTDDSNQKWKLYQNGDGSYTFLSKLDENFCLDLADAKTTDGTNLVLYRRDSNRGSQRFEIDSAGSAEWNGSYTIQSVASGKLIDISSASFADEKPAICYKPNDGLNQRFVFTYNQQTGYYTITSANSNKVLDVKYATYADEGSVIQYSSNGAFNQQWHIQATSGGVYIYAAHSGQSLDLWGGDSSDGTPVITWDFHGRINQQWKLNPISLIDGNLNNIVATSGRLMDIVGNSEADGAGALIYTSNGNLNQKFFAKQIGGSASTTYALECARSGKLLSTDGTTGNSVYQYADQGNGSGDAYQQWVVEPAGNASFRFKNVATGTYLDYGSGANDTYLQLAGMGSFSSQAWKFAATDPLPDGLYTFASALNNDLVFDIAGHSLEPGIPLALWTAKGEPHQTFKSTKLGTGRYSIINLNSGLALDVYGSSVDSSTGAGTVIQWNAQNDKNNQIWNIEYVGKGCFRFVSILQNGQACMTVGSSSPTDGTSVGLLKINGSDTQAFKPTPVGSINYYQMNYTLDQFVGWQSGAGFDTLKYYIDPTNKAGYSFMQFADIRIGTGVTGAQLNAFINTTSSGRSGIFQGRGQAFVDAAKKYGINEVYFLSHAILESAWGTSSFARGNYYDGQRLINGKTYPAGTYYNFWGIAAYDSSPNDAIDYAITHGWDSPENAIDGSAQWIAEHYIYGTYFSSVYPQPTVYALRWDYARANALGRRGGNQYATSLTWANSIPQLMNQCYDYLDVTPQLYYVVPRFK